MATTQNAASPLLASSPSVLPLNSKPDALAILGQLPLLFEPNQGQADPGVKFVAQGAGYSLLLDATGATLRLQTHGSPAGHIVRMKLAGANPAAATVGSGLLPGKSNYLIGSDPNKWHSGISQFSGVRYESVFPGIDLVFYGKQGRLEYDFMVAPGADPAKAELEFDGATKLELSGGDLVLTGAGDAGLRLQAPQIYQREGDLRKPVAGRFVLHAANRVGFEIGAYDRSRELVIDPVLQFSTYFGGAGTQTSPSVAVNGNGSIYLVGSTTAFTQMTASGTVVPSTQIGAGAHIFVARIIPSSPATVSYLTFLGGSGTDTSVGLGVDGGGNAYIVGNTNSSDFPTIGAPYQSKPEAKTQCGTSATCNSAFVSELDTLGASLVYSSYLSGNGDDEASGMTIDVSRDVFVTGTTTSNQEPLTDEFPATQLPVPYQSAPKSGSTIQFFVTKVNTNVPGTASIAYSTYFGGADNTGGTTAIGGGIAIDATGNVYFSGTTNFFNSGSGQFGSSGNSTDFPILNAYQPCLDTPPPTTLSNPNPCSVPAGTPFPTDAFMAKLNINNAQTGALQLIFSTYLGGTLMDSSTALAIDPGAATTGTANIYLTGTTNSPDFVLPNGAAAFQGCLNNPGQVVTATSQCTVINSNTDAYVARFSNPTASTNGTQVNVGLTYFSYLGGAGNDSAAAIAVDTATDAFVTGTTDSTNFPVTTGAIQSTLNGTQNAFFAHIDTTTVSGQNGVGSYATYFGGNGVDRGTGIAVDPITLNAYFAGDTTSSNFQTQGALQTTLLGTRNAFVTELVPAPSVRIVPAVTTTQIVGAGNQVTVTFNVTNDGPDLATGIVVSGTVSSANITFNSAAAGSGSCNAPVSNSVVCRIPTLQAGSVSAVTFVVTPSQPGSFEATAQVTEINNTNTIVTASAPYTATGFSMSVSPSSRTVPAGQVAQYTVQLSPSGAFGPAVSLTLTGLPASTTDNFTSTSVTFSGGGTGAASTVLNVTTTPQPVTTVDSGRRRSPLYALWLLPGMAVFGLSAVGNRRRWLGLLALAVLSALIVLQPSCSSGGKTPPQVSGTPSGTYTMTVTATSGTFSQSQSIQMTVVP